ncbi:LLM class flavin-dependent oxidoreductase [Microvirga sp. 2MCAF38]|uniref:LLM class flavin-dependent oxidoreductase n=1 Tax=Microvirga sp. 2MCAF38 TaxID=3232989 RepID=UPI003F9B6469
MAKAHDAGPLQLAAIVAQKTKRLKIGLAIMVLPFHHPLRLAAWKRVSAAALLRIGLSAIKETCRTMRAAVSLKSISRS